MNNVSTTFPLPRAGYLRSVCSVRVLVQRKATREFLRARKRWTLHEPDALDFKKTARAIEHCVRERIEDAQLVLAFEENRQLDIILPIHVPRRSSLFRTSGI